MLDKIKYSFYKFMQGRYGSRGMDLLTRRLNALFLILIVLSLILSIAGRSNSLVWILAIITLVFMYFRLFSKNISARAKENARYQDLESRVRKSLSKIKRSFFGTKDHVYTSCPECKTQLRLPRGKGKLKVTCPNCKTIFVKRT